MFRRNRRDIIHLFTEDISPGRPESYDSDSETTSDDQSQSGGGSPSTPTHSLWRSSRVTSSWLLWPFCLVALGEWGMEWVIISVAIGHLLSIWAIASNRIHITIQLGIKKRSIQESIELRIRWYMLEPNKCYNLHIVICSFEMRYPVYAWKYRPGPIWEPEYVTEVMGPQRYKVKLLNEDQLWHWHQNQLCYHQVEDDDKEGAEIACTDAN